MQARHICATVTHMSFEGAGVITSADMRGKVPPLLTEYNRGRNFNFRGSYLKCGGDFRLVTHAREKIKAKSPLLPILSPKNSPHGSPHGSSSRFNSRGSPISMDALEKRVSTMGSLDIEQQLEQVYTHKFMCAGARANVRVCSPSHSLHTKAHVSACHLFSSMFFPILFFKINLIFFTHSCGEKHHRSF